MATLASDIRSVRERLETHIEADEEKWDAIAEDQRQARVSRTSIHARIDNINTGQNRILLAIAGFAIATLVTIVLTRSHLLPS